MVLNTCLQVDFGIFILIDLGDECNLQNSSKSTVKEYGMTTSTIPCVIWPVLKGWIFQLNSTANLFLLLGNF